MGLGFAVEHQAVPIEAPGQFRVFGKPARVRQRYEIQPELGVRRIGFPEAAAAPEVGQAAIDAHTRPGADQDGFRRADRLGCSLECVFASSFVSHLLTEIDSVLSDVRSRNVLKSPSFSLWLFAKASLTTDITRGVPFLHASWREYQCIEWDWDPGEICNLRWVAPFVPSPKPSSTEPGSASLATGSIRSGFLFSGFRRWGRLAIRGPFRCKHRIKLRKPRPGHQGPRVGVSLPGHDRWGRIAIRGPFRCKHRIKHRKRRPGHQGPRVGVSLPGHDRWGRLAIRGPFRCKHRIKHRKRRPGHQGPRVGAGLPGHDRWGRLAIRGPFRCKHRIKHRKRRPGHQGPRGWASACPATTVGAGLPSGGLSGASTG